MFPRDFTGGMEIEARKLEKRNYPRISMLVPMLNAGRLAGWIAGPDTCVGFVGNGFRTSQE
jgi:hypothetical protein